MDLEKAKEEFLKYVSNYDENDRHIKRKKEHSLRVMQISEVIAKEVGLEGEDLELATLIGLLHDIGRFEQVRIYHTFYDSKSFDHGDYGVKVLMTNNFIRKFIETDKYDEIIFIAIRNHNKLSIEEGLDEKQSMFAKIVRDADKLDILYQSTYLTWTDCIDEIENATITKDKEEIKPFVAKRIINYRIDLLEVGAIKRILIKLGFIFDINFAISFKLLKEADYINKIIDRFDFKNKDTKELMEEIRDILNNYIKDKQKG